MRKNLLVAVLHPCRASLTIERRETENAYQSEREKEERVREKLKRNKEVSEQRQVNLNQTLGSSIKQEASEARGGGRGGRSKWLAGAVVVIAQ